MTVGTQLKQVLADLKSVQASLETFAAKARDPGAREIFRQAAAKTERMVAAIRERVEEIEREEPEYRENGEDAKTLPPWNRS